MAESKGPTKSDQKSPEEAKSNNYYIAGIAAAIAVAALVILLLIFTRENATKGQSFAGFMSNFDSAKRVGIYAIGSNSIQLSSSISCSTALIERLLESSTTRRNASTIDYYAINSTTCDYLHGLNGENGSTTTPQDCIALSSSEPSIFINYSDTNSTTIIHNNIYFSGNQKFLLECGISEEIN